MWKNPFTVSPLSHYFLIFLWASVSLPRDPALYDDMPSFSPFDCYFLPFSLFSTISPLLSSLRRPPINTPLPPDRVTDHFSMLYIPRRQYLLYMLPLLLLLHPVCHQSVCTSAHSSQLQWRKILISAQITRLTPTFRLILSGLSNALNGFFYLHDFFKDAWKQNGQN